MELSVQTSRLVTTSGKTVSFIPVLPTGHDGLGTHTLTLPYSPSSASIHPILQDRFVTGNSGDEWVRVHGMDGEEREVLKGHHGPVHCVEFSPDGEMYASGSGAFYILFLARPLTDYFAEDGKWRPDSRTHINLVECRNHPSVADYAWQNIWFMARDLEWPLKEGVEVCCMFERLLVVCALVRIIMSASITLRILCSVTLV